MIEIRIHGRGGQGGVTLAKLIAAAEHREGRSVQAFGIYAAERSGAPVQAFLRADEEPIHNPNQIYEPDHLIVLDPTLISPVILSGLKPGGWILLNCETTPEHYAGQERVNSFRIATIDATSIAVKHGLGSRTVPIVNTALAGAAARLLGMNLESVVAAFEDFGFHGGNQLAAREAWDEVRVQKDPPKPGEFKKQEISHARGHAFIGGNEGAPPAIHTGQWANQQPAWENATPPCNFICPAGNDVQGFLAALTEEDVDGALEILLQTSPLPSVCGRVCPGFCMMQCNRSELEGPVNVRGLERYAGDHGEVQVTAAAGRPEQVAVIGAGPAGLSGAYHLARLGYGVTIYEAGSELGGLMRTGIPEYRLPRAALDRDIERITRLGVKTVFNRRIDHRALEELTHEYDAVMAATGLQRLTSIDLGLDLGTDQGRVLQGIEFLDKARCSAVEVTGEDVVVVGGGNTAIDAARSALRLGANEVRIIYRRTRDEMPAIPEEVDDAIDEGIQIDFLCSPVRITREGEKRQLSCQRMELGEPDESGRRRPVVIPGAEFEIPCDRVILAVGQAADLSLLPEGAELSEDHPVEETVDAPVYGAGDLLTNEGTVTAAIGCGRDMALMLHERFSGEKRYADPPDEATVVRADQVRFQHFEMQHRHDEKVLPFERRSGSFDEVRQGLEGVDEARRCLSCGVCNSCDRCVTYCPDGVLKRVGKEIVFDYDYCKGCGVCVSECSRAVIYMKTA
ncbi:MAG: FAD-dependent oxidoreductase [Xanthomonadales bacterium]|nr:2-oxoacid:acceptor oxidoreductase family protein [Gammaproteobacteria bacterium]MBT8053202.1 2-oxoacid:acceptor oxidoreductase family protein [Gammaproteobacteria bacterium]NND58347.1 FAD-dependent oxidoreductase [Xanthomonadales bacterium]NNK50241.1 FAD-dependent oxidoreductase [Xanthomonadales bacterium]